MKTTLLFIGMALLSFSMANGQIVESASDNGIFPNNSRSANREAIQIAFNKHLAGNLDVLQFENGTFNIDGTIEIAGWDGLQIIGSGSTTISTNIYRPIFRSINNADPVKDGSIENLKLESTAQAAQYPTKSDFDNNPGLFFLGNIAFENFVFDTVEFTAPNADVNGIYISNSWGSSRITQGITVKDCDFNNLGRMGMEFFNEPNPNVVSDMTSRFENISVEGNNFEELGHLFDFKGRYHGIGISFGGTGKNHNVTGNTFGPEIRTINIESAGVENLTIANNQHLGSPGSMYQFNAPLSENITITNDQAFDYYYVASEFHFLKNLTIENSKLYGGINFGNNSPEYDADGNYIPPSDVSDVWINNSTIINNLDLTGAYGALAFYGVRGTVDNINFENSYIGELAPSASAAPVIFSEGTNITNISFTNSCLFHFGNKYDLIQGSNVDFGIDRDNYSSDCADIFFPPTVNDEILSVDAPKDVVRGTTVTVSVDYSASEARDILVDFRLMSAPYTNYNTVVRGVEAGSDTVNILMDIPANVPVANEAYRFRIFMRPAGQTTGNVLASAYPGKISVTDGAPPTGNMSNVTVSKNVVRGTIENLSIDYSVSHTSDISVEFRLMSSPHTTYSSSIVTVNPGSGNEQISIDIPANVPVANEAYRYRIFLLPTGQTGWGNTLATAYPSKISVSDQGTNFKATLDFQSIANSNDLETLSVYPNPAINSIKVHVPYNESYSSYTLYAINGAMVKEGAIDSKQKELYVPFSDVAKGLYVLRLSNSNGEEAFKKVVKQ